MTGLRAYILQPQGKRTSVFSLCAWHVEHFDVHYLTRYLCRIRGDKDYFLSWQIERERHTSWAGNECEATVLTGNRDPGELSSLNSTSSVPSTLHGLIWPSVTHSPERKTTYYKGLFQLSGPELSRVMCVSMRDTGEAQSKSTEVEKGPCPKKGRFYFYIFYVFPRRILLQ